MARRKVIRVAIFIEKSTVLDELSTFDGRIDRKRSPCLTRVFYNECFPFHTFRYYNRERNSIEQASPVTERNALARRNRRI